MNGKARDAAYGMRFQIRRAGVLNVWQYDEQVFEFADGRLLLRGANGAGKSKTMEMLLPFVIDGDKGRLTASGRHHTSLLWLMLDGYDGVGRTGYLWVEFGRTLADGSTETVTCGVGLRATASSRAATAWFFTSPRRVGIDLILENETGPLGQAALVAEVERDGLGQAFESPKRYREHVGQLLFGLPLDHYEALLRLVYWLRQPQVGEDIDPKRLAEQLVNALPVVAADTLRSAGDTFDELQAFGEEIDRRKRTAVALTDFVATYAAYARSVVADHGARALAASAQVRAAQRQLNATERELVAATAGLDTVSAARADADAAYEEARTRIHTLESSPEAKSREFLGQLALRVETLSAALTRATALSAEASARASASANQADTGANDLMARATYLHDVTEQAAAALLHCGAATSPAPSAALLVPRPAWVAPADPAESGELLLAASRAHEDWAGAGAPLVGEVAATVQVVSTARVEAESARQRADEAQRRADNTERRADVARAAVATAATDSAATEATFVGALRAWEAAAGAISFTAPDLTAEGLSALASLAAAAAEPEQRHHNEALGTARAAIAAGESHLAQLRSQRRAIDAETDPAPAAPLWHRDDRGASGGSGPAEASGGDSTASGDARVPLRGAPLWRLVDFRATLTASQRAGLESALEGAGLLDAWVTPDGNLLAGPRDDLVLTPFAGSHRAATAASLAQWLVAEANPTLGVPVDVIEAVLRALPVSGAESDGTKSDGTKSDGDESDGDEADPGAAEIWVALDGRWRIGPAHGRSHKSVAQFIGATARASERARRLAALDAEIADQNRLVAQGRAAAGAAEAALRVITRWLADRPGHDQLLRAWATEAAQVVALSAVEAELGADQDAARAARAEATARHTGVVALGRQHGLPITADGLLAWGERVRSADQALAAVIAQASDLVSAIARWGEVAERARSDGARLGERADEERAAQQAWHEANTEHEELTRAQGADIAELDRRLGELRAQARAAQEATQRQTAEAQTLTKAVGGLEQKVDGDRERLALVLPLREVAFEALRGLFAVPGLIGATDIGLDPAAPPSDREAIKELTERAQSGSHANANAVLLAVTQLQSGPAAITEPRVVESQGAYAAIGRDEGTGDLPLAELAGRLTTRVAADRELLTDRERTLFETHILGQLGDALRGVRRQAEELVTAMNDQLKVVTTSQGIRVRLRWRLREDIPADARKAVELLGQPLGALLPDERVELRESLHRLIDLSRAEAPEDSYTEHLARALDYRQWFSFTVQYHRPETGDWRDLQRKSALSQGEQKVLCYLPLFAAAAAHFTSLAGAAPHAPRFVLLDDAFPKIDARTHPLLFGLLVDLDLDFVVTSERLWGTHATVPSLAIYEALRNPAERGIAQFEHRWDGHQLTAVGAGD